MTTDTQSTVRTRTDLLYRILAGKIAAYHNCRQAGNLEWLNRHADSVEQITKDLLPSGSGLDSGCTIDLDECSGEKIIIRTSYHHMHESGMYDGWTEHAITVRASLISGVDVTVSGRNRNDIKDYLGALFQHNLTATVIESYDPTDETTTFRYQAEV